MNEHKNTISRIKEHQYIIPINTLYMPYFHTFITMPNRRCSYILDTVHAIGPFFTTQRVCCKFYRLLTVCHHNSIVEEHVWKVRGSDF